MKLKTAAFTVRATALQSARWKQAAESEGHASVGTWLAEAVDAYLEHRTRAGKPLPLFWSRGHFCVELEDESMPEVRGWIARPFGIFRGTEDGPRERGSKVYTLAYLPSGRPVATFRSARHCKALAGELARLWVRWGGREPQEDAGPVVERLRREEA